MRATTYEKLTQAGMTPPEVGPGSIATTRVVSVDGADGRPVIGLSYACDFAAEQEMGVGAMKVAFHRASAPDSIPALFEEEAVTGRQSELVADDDTAAAFSTLPVADARLAKDVTSGLIRRLDPERFNAPSIDLLTADQVRALLPRDAQPPVRTRKADLVAAARALPLPESDSYPGWFGTGDTLVVLKGVGAHRVVVDAMVSAARAGTLLMGGLGRRSFGTGLTMLDSRDLSDQDVNDLVDAESDYRLRMAALQPVADELRSRGFAWYALGTPREFEAEGRGPEVHYWLNATSIRIAGRIHQPYGWYTLEELLAEKFIADCASSS